VVAKISYEIERGERCGMERSKPQAEMEDNSVHWLWDLVHSNEVSRNCWYCLNQYEQDICAFCKLSENDITLEKYLCTARECQKKNLKLPRSIEEFSRVL